MSLILDVLDENWDSLNDLNVYQSILERQKAREMTLTDILLNKFLKVDTFLILLAKDKEFG